jgi:hypothetical protein
MSECYEYDPRFSLSFGLPACCFGHLRIQISKPQPSILLQCDLFGLPTIHQLSSSSMSVSRNVGVTVFSNDVFSLTIIHISNVKCPSLVP